MARRDLAAEIRAAGTPEGRRATAREHAAADAACGRDWLTGGCCCGACRLARAEIARENAAVPEKGSHGGKREGAGRKPVVQDGIAIKATIPADVAARYAAEGLRREPPLTAAEVLREVAILNAPPE